MRVTDKNYSKHIHFYSGFAPQNLEELVKAEEISTLLDLGCGDGATLFALKKRNLLKSKTVFAIDISKDRIAKTQKIDNDFQCFVADACQLSKVMRPKSVDLVISSQVIEHIPDQKKLVRQIRRVLKPGGFLYLSTVFKKWYGWYFYKSERGKWVLDPTHLREYQREEELIPSLIKSGFRIIHNQKILWKFPLTDFFLKRLGFKSDIYQRNRGFRILRSIKIPILGYYYWELVFQKKVGRANETKD